MARHFEILSKRIIVNRYRATEIDGIRGWAAFWVLLFHVFHEMLTKLLPWVNSPWLTPVLNGRLPVCIFFVLSGDALTVGRFSRGTPVDRLVARRYTRLTVPILASCLLVFLVRLLHWDFHQAASVIVNRPEWLGSFIDFPFSVISLLRYALIGVYANNMTDSTYNPFLWTMSVEMVGSMMVFLLCYQTTRHLKTLLALLGAYLFLLDSYYCLFLAGMLLGRLRAEGFFEHERPWLYLALLASAITALGLLRGRPVTLQVDLVIAVAVVFVCYGHKGVRRLMQSDLSMWLGKISFPLYLVQFAMIISLESWLIVRWNFGRPAWLVGIGLVTVAVSLMVATLFQRVEFQLIELADRTMGYLFGMTSRKWPGVELRPGFERPALESAKGP